MLAVIIDSVNKSVRQVFALCGGIAASGSFYDLQHLVGDPSLSCRLRRRSPNSPESQLFGFWPVIFSVEPTRRANIP
jgi:hypothetical protein